MTGNMLSKTCNCGFFIWHRHLDFDILEQAVSNQSKKWAEDALPHVKEAIKDIEKSCEVHLDKAKLTLESLEDFIKTDSWEEASDAVLAIRQNIGSELYFCSEKEE